MFKKTKKMSLLEKFRGIRGRLLCLVCGGLLLSATQDALAQGDPPDGNFANLTAQFLRVRNSLGSSRIAFGPNNVRTVGLDAPGGLTGMVLRDPVGLRLIGTGVNPGRLLFGPTNDCTVEVSPRGPTGLLLRDPKGIRILPPIGGRTTMLFGPTDDCSLGIDANLTGLIESDPIGFRLLGRGGAGCRVLFGRTDDCTIEVDPVGPSGLILRDPKGIRILNPNRAGANVIQFGLTDLCNLRTDPQLKGLIASDPQGLRLLGPEGRGCILLFGPTDECRIFVDPNRAGLNFSDPKGFTFDNNIGVEGTVSAQDFVTTSSRRFKENIQPLENALDKITSLQGVTFDWKADRGGKPDIGFIAEEVEKVAPELVSWDEKHQSVQGVKYANVVAVAVEGIKEQQKQIDMLQKENSSLRENLDSFQSQIDELTKKIKELANTKE
jgi:Chaperone of endosialidase